MQGGCGFLGMGGMVARNPVRLGDPARYYNSDEDVYSTLAGAFDRIAEARVRVIVTHQPPRGAQDTLYNGQSSGSVGLRRFVEEFQPDLLLCGHIHEDRGEARIGSTKIVNVGELRRGFGALIEIDEQINVNWIELQEGKIGR
ncbi:Metallophosphoesterase, calcineurin superfamily [uncultured archaeon]|nr:Metallophosphoesterase, calcineurin superfamily [uncultured archaeon]